MNQMQNVTIREQAKACNIRLWEIAEALGISEATMVRRMRRELPEAEQSRICCIINDLVVARERGA